MAEAVYVLCGVTSLGCAALLVRGWRRDRTPLLLWAAVCFIALALNNLLLSVDLIIVPERDLSVLRGAIALGGLTALLCALIWQEPSR
jgi:hypothetical protein